MSIEVLNESGHELDVNRLAALSRFVMDQMRVHPLAELCIKAVDEPTIATLNEQWMEKEGPTDVLAFPMDELRPGLVNEDPEEGVLGDLVLCPAVAERQGATAGHGTEAEIELLTVHGILHLLGYDHAEPEEHREMFGLQDELLAAWRAEPGVRAGERPDRRSGRSGDRRRPRRPGGRLLGRRRRAHDVLPRPRGGARRRGPGRRRAAGGPARRPRPLPQHRHPAAPAVRDRRRRCCSPSWCCGGTTARVWPTILTAVGVMLVVSFVVIGVAPRTLGRQHADRVAPVAAAILTVATRVLGPIPQLLILVGNAITPGRGFRTGPFSTETELRELVDYAEASAVIESGERAMIHSVFEFGDTIAREVMVPRGDVVYIERYKNLRQTLSLFLRSGFSRVPVIDENLDDIVGFAYLKDVVRRDFEDPDVEFTQRVDEVMRPALYVPESKPVDALLSEMQASRQHIAVVVDEYGGTAGLVTIEDLLEEIVGEITDEYDAEQVETEPLDDGSVRVLVALPDRRPRRAVRLRRRGRRRRPRAAG